MREGSEASVAVLLLASAGRRSCRCSSRIPATRRACSAAVGHREERRRTGAGGGRGGAGAGTGLALLAGPIGWRRPASEQCSFFFF